MFFANTPPVFTLSCLEKSILGGKRGESATTLFLQRFSVPLTTQTCRDFTPFAPKPTFFLVLQGKFRGHHSLQSSPTLLPSASSTSTKQSCFFLFFLCFCYPFNFSAPAFHRNSAVATSIYLSKTNKNPRKLVSTKLLGLMILTAEDFVVGDDGNRTRVRRPFYKNFSHHSLFIRILQT